MARLLFEKTGDAVCLSHLDLMRMFQRAFRRAGVSIKHNNGFNQRDHLSILMPLSVGTASRCELLEFDTEDDCQDLTGLPDRLNATLQRGVKALSLTEGGLDLKALAWLDASLALEYDAGVPADACGRITALLGGETLVVEKRTKKGPKETDIRPLLRSFSTAQKDGNTLEILCRVAAREPALNPDLLAAAIARYCPDLKPDFFRVTRLEVYDEQEEVFR